MSRLEQLDRVRRQKGWRLRAVVVAPVGRAREVQLELVTPREVHRGPCGLPADAQAAFILCLVDRVRRAAEGGR